MKHVIQDYLTGVIYFEGIDKADCVSELRKAYMLSLEQNKLKEFTLVYQAIPEEVEFDNQLNQVL